MVRRDAGPATGRRDPPHAHEPGRDPRARAGASRGTSARSKMSRTRRRTARQPSERCKLASRPRRLVAETSRILVTASVDDVEDRVEMVLERLARFVGADSAVLAARMSELKAGSPRQHVWYAPEVGRAGPGDRRRLGRPASRSRSARSRSRGVGASRPEPARSASRSRSWVTHSSRPWRACAPRPRCATARSGSARWPSTRRTTCSSTASSGTFAT